MRFTFGKTLFILASLILTGCAEPVLRSQDAIIAQARFSARECGGPGQDRCNFFNSPVQLQGKPVRVATRSAEFFPTANRLEFVDSEASRWIAPRRTLTDGASIPSIFVPIIGARRSPEFVNAAAVHDAYCGIGNETLPEYHSRTWKQTHRMFYDALRVGGTDEIRAKVMFAAVYLGGPRWQDEKRMLTHVPTHEMQRVMRDARRYIEQTTPTPSRARIEAWLTRREKKLLRELRRDDDERSDTQPPEPGPIDPPGDDPDDDPIGDDPDDDPIVDDPDDDPIGYYPDDDPIGGSI